MKIITQKNAYRLLLLGLMLTSSSCFGTKEMKHRDSSFVLSSSELIEFEEKASKGDETAAWKLYTHFSLGLRDDEKAAPWLEKAVDLGDQRAIRMKAIKLNNSR